MLLLVAFWLISKLINVCFVGINILLFSNVTGMIIHMHLELLQLYSHSVSYFI